MIFLSPLKILSIIVNASGMISTHLDKVSGFRRKEMETVYVEIKPTGLMC